MASRLRDDLLDRLVGELGALEGRVDLVHVRLMMLVVVQMHRLRVDVRLQRLVGVRKGGYLVCHLAVSLVGGLVVGLYP